MIRIARFVLDNNHLLSYPHPRLAKISHMPRLNMSFHTAWKAGIQLITDFNHYNVLDPGFRRCDDVFFNKLLAYSEKPT